LFHILKLKLQKLPLLKVFQPYKTKSLFRGFIIQRLFHLPALYYKRYNQRVPDVKPVLLTQKAATLRFQFE
ncbi:MAG TPA: hypothetical protein VF540_12635, partial [Segetibacter sp.]